MRPGSTARADRTGLTAPLLPQVDDDGQVATCGAEAPELASRALESFGRSRHEVLATLRRDGSPRVSGIEVDFADGELWIGCLRRSRKALDLLRDARFALHSGSVDPPT